MSLLFHRVVFKGTVCPATNKDFMKNTISLLYYMFVIVFAGLPNLLLPYCLCV